MASYDSDKGVEGRADFPSVELLLNSFTLPGAPLPGFPSSASSPWDTGTHRVTILAVTRSRPLFLDTDSL